MALGEAQAIGVPAVVQPIGCVAERVVDGQTGYVTHNDDDFANRAIDILTKDDLWQQLHQQSIQLQQSWNWDMAAAMFEKLAAN
jgi:glycosyltransferase involved in cell wall biosynthesis